MKVVILSHSDVEQLLSAAQCIEVVENALHRLDQGYVHQPLRYLERAEHSQGILGLMPGHDVSGDRSFYGLKEVCVFPNNPSRGLDSHLGAVLLHDGETGELLAIANASAITALRTAAVSAVATRALSRPDSRVMVIAGTGTQARAHLEAIPLVRDLDEVRVVGSTPEKAEAFVAAQSGVNVRLVPVDTLERAAKGAHIIVTCTSAREPILDADSIEPGMHLNLVGSSVKSAREATGAAMARGSIFVDRRESTLNESGDYLEAVAEGAISADSITAELGEVLSGKHPGRTSASEVTIFKSLGLAIEDLAAAEHLLEAASRTGRGTWVDF